MKLNISVIIPTLNEEENTEKIFHNIKLLKAKEILIVDGEYFSWYGSRLVDSPAYFSSIHRQLISN